MEFVSQWNNLKREYGLPLVRKVTPDMRKTYRAKRRDYTRNDSRDAVNNYLMDIKKRDAMSSYGKHRFTFFEFIKQSN